MRGLFAVAAFAGLSGCTSLAPLDEAERARVRVVAPVAARFPPKVDSKVPLGEGKAEGAVLGATGTALQGGPVCVFLVYTGPGLALCLAAVGAGAAFGAAAAPSTEGLESMAERARKHFGAPNVQQLLAKRFTDRVTRLTSHKLDYGASKLGPQSPDDAPNYSGTATGGGTLVAELAVESVGVSLVGPGRLVHLELSARMRLVRPSGDVTLMAREYSVARDGRFVQEYEDDATLLLREIAAAVDVIATLMVDDAFLLRTDAAGVGGALAPTVAALDPLPSERCYTRTYDCWAFRRAPTLDTVTPKFRWKPFPESRHLETSPWLRTARNFVYDLWIFGGDDDRVVEGLTVTEHTLERPLSPCKRYFWTVRARFDTEAGPRAAEWSSASGSPRSVFGPTVRAAFGAPFITSCAAE